MYLGSAILGGHLVLGLSVQGTRSLRTSCPGGHVRGGDMSSYDTVYTLCDCTVAVVSFFFWFGLSTLVFLLLDELLLWYVRP